MTQVFAEDGAAIPVTVLEYIPMTVTQLKTVEKDGYQAVQFGYLDAKAKHLSKPEQGHFAKNNVALFRHLKEWRVDSLDGFELGQQFIELSEETLPFNIGDKISVRGTSKGKGFQGATKMWGFSRGPMSHGSKSHRIPGSIGPGTTPGRVLKGKKMARNMGNETVVTSGIEVVAIMPEQNAILVKGAVPGPNKGLITLFESRIPGVNSGKMPAAV